MLSTAFAMLMCVQVRFDLPLPHPVITLLFGGAVLYGLTKWGGLTASPLLPVVQKVVLILTVAWLGVLARHLCARDRGL